MVAKGYATRGEMGWRSGDARIGTTLRMWDQMARRCGPTSGQRPTRHCRPDQPGRSGRHGITTLGAPGLEQGEQTAAERLQRLRHRRLRQMAAGGLPVAQRGQPPALRFVGEAPDRHPQQPRAGAGRGRRFQAQLHQERAALAARAPARQVEGEIQALLIGEGAGVGIVAPGGEVGAGVREVSTKQGRGRGDGLGQLQRTDLIAGIHAVAPAAEPNIPET